MNPENPRRFVKTGNLFYPTLVIIAATVLIVWLSGRDIHRTAYKNAITSVSLLAAGCFIFLTWALYYGYRLKDNIGRLNKPYTGKLYPTGINPFTRDMDYSDNIFPDIIFSLFVLVFILVFVYIFGVFLWTGIVAFIAMLYWLYYRAVKLVFRKGAKCRNNLSASAAYALLYTALYSCWIYAIILGLHFIR